MTAPAAGFFGKLPATGDFVSRGLPDAFRRSWDAWVTRHLAGRLRAGVEWPDGGLRFRLTSGGRVAAGVVLASGDSAGRAFPLSLVLIGDALPAPQGLDGWCVAAARLGGEAMAGGQGPDWLWARLDEIPEPETADRDEGNAGRRDEHGWKIRPGHPLRPGRAPLLLWSDSSAPAPADPDGPGDVLDRLLPISSG